MKIRAYLPYADERPAGLGRFAAELCEALRARGAEVEVIFGHLEGAPAWALRGSRRVVLPAWLHRVRGLRLAKPLLRVLWLQLGLPLLAARDGELPLLLLAHESAPFPSRDQVAVVHDLTALRPYSGRTGMLRRWHHALWLMGLRRSRHVIAVSDATRDELVARYPELAPKIVVVHEGVDHSVFRPDDAGAMRETLPSDLRLRPFLLYAGTLSPHKNVSLLVPLLARLASTAQELRLVVAGRYTEEELESLRRHAASHAVAERVVPLGYVSDAMLAALMRHCAAFTFPSRNEGFGLAVAEAMACGAPVLASNAGSLPEVVGSGGVLLPPDDADAWAAAGARVLTDASFRARVVEAGLARARELTWDRAAQRYLDLLRPTTSRVVAGAGAGSPRRRAPAGADALPDGPSAAARHP